MTEQRDSREPRSSTLTEAFESQVTLRGDASAVRDGESTISYRALDTVANDIADSLGRHPRVRSQPNDPVAVMIAPSIVGVAALVGVLKAGSAYVVLDPSHPIQVLREILGDTRSNVLLTDSNNSTVFGVAQSLGISVLDVNDCSDGKTGRSAKPVVESDDLAWLHYTSGSTGKPKGVMQRHGDSTHFVRAFIEAAGLKPDDRTTMLHGYLSLDLYGPLLSGACLNIFDLKQRGFSELSTWLRASDITVLSTLPTTFRSFFSSLREGQTFPSIRQVRLGGETMRYEDVELFHRRSEVDAELLNWLGSTESGIAYEFVDRQAVRSNEQIRFSQWIPDTVLAVVDAHGDLASPGEIGEITVSSRFLFPGYWRRPELTARVIGSDPEDPSVRRFRTGDAGRIDESGVLTYLGRQDFLVKIRGHLVSLVEVEECLSALPDVRDVAVVPHQTQARSQLVCYVVFDNEAEANVKVLRKQAEAVLTQHLRPSRYVVCESLPLTKAGKVDRLKLQSQDIETLRATDADRLPSGPTEEVVAEIWRDVLEMNEVYAEQNFWHAGGDSLSALEILARINVTFEVSLAPELLLKADTIAALARLVSVARPGELSTHKCLLTFQYGADHPGLFCVHHHLGTAFCFRELATHFPEHRPVYGLQAAGLAGVDQCHESIEDMAACYVREMREAQPHGPYHILGYCFGGWVAVEIAQQLRAQGEQVDFLGVVDLDGPGSKRQSLGQRLVRRLAVEAANLNALNTQEKIAYLRIRGSLLLGKLMSEEARRSADDETLPMRLRALARASSIAQRAYTVPWLGGELCLFRGPYPLISHYADPTFGWNSVFEDTRVNFIANSRLSGDGVKALANIIESQLSKSCV